MDVAIDLMNQMNHSYRFFFLAFSVVVFVLPLFLNRSSLWKSSYQQLKEAKMLLEMQKILLEINEKATESSGDFVHRSKAKLIDREPNFKERFSTTAAHRVTDEVSYYEKVRNGMLGSLLFFLLMGIIMLQRSENSLVGGPDHVGYLARELGLWAATAFGATLIPWGSKFFYFAYGFFVPILVATIIVII